MAIFKAKGIETNISNGRIIGKVRHDRVICSKNLLPKVILSISSCKKIVEMRRMTRITKIKNKKKYVPLVKESLDLVNLSIWKNNLSQKNRIAIL